MRVQIAANAEMDATTRPSARMDQPCMSRFALCSSHNSFDPARAVAGTPSKNENRAASLRLKPSASAAVRVDPDRETPGMRAPTCASPTSSASTNDAFSTLRRWRASISVRPIKTAIAMQAQPITGNARRGELQVLRLSDSRIPASTLGIVARAIQITRRRSGSANCRRPIADTEPTARRRASRQNSL